MKPALAAVIGLFYLALAVMMLADPHGWYQSTPGVAGTGPYNAHFITDVALAFAASGLLWLAASALGYHRAGLALGASLWPALHAGFHLVEWAREGLPKGNALWAEGLGVVAIAAIALGLAISVFRTRTR
jgi:hypothetical protein